jgi:hypothetical protein
MAPSACIYVAGLWEKVGLALNELSRRLKWSGMDGEEGRKRDDY